MADLFNIVQISSPRKEEFRIYTEPQYKGFQTLSIKGKKNLPENRYRSNLRAKRKLQELLDINFYAEFTFVTLTFKENITDIDVANTIFSNFIRRLRYFLKRQSFFDFKYICVVETQKRGAIHYHVVCNLPKYTQYAALIKIWNKSISSKLGTVGFCGSVYVNYSDSGISDTDNISRYLGKYLISSEVNPIFFGKKIYFTSKNLLQPVRKDHFYKFSNELSKEHIITEIENIFSKDISNNSRFSETSYINKYTGKEILLLQYKK